MFAFCEISNVSVTIHDMRASLLTTKVYYSTQIDEMPMNVADLIA